ncbi:putative 2-dehydropantoate 2-reductase [Candidatus Laterigemmans baculatus]|uniref:putative 2-dehydropantoate 2-reductase n=1 Tax=Candidatus Laterigemmans baculatus TaxID=2770505 RepID=UPI0013DA0452|nr:putative 2-dehydropantoate 2-reductase [Candidatus Laterigemmans baculatus]
MTRRSFAIIGTGALGGFYGGLLARAGFDVHFLLRSDLEHVREHGLQVESKLGDFHLPHVQAYGSAAEMPECDVTILALKTTQNHLLDELLPPVTGRRGIVLVLQNGLCPEADSAAIVGPDRVLGGVCFLCSNKVGPGHIRHLDYGRIVLGEHRVAEAPPAGITPRVAQLVEDLRSAGIDAHGSEDQWRARWKKLMWNIPFNGLSVVLSASTDTLIQIEPSAALAASLSEEVRAAAEACGRSIEREAVDEIMEHTRDMVPYDSSMRLDYLARRPMEVEAIFGEPVRAAERAGFDPKQVRMLYWQLKFLGSLNTSTESEY